MNSTVNNSRFLCTFLFAKIENCKNWFFFFNFTSFECRCVLASRFTWIIVNGVFISHVETQNPLWCYSHLLYHLLFSAERVYFFMLFFCDCSSSFGFWIHNSIISAFHSAITYIVQHFLFSMQITLKSNFYHVHVRWQMFYNPKW